MRANRHTVPAKRVTPGIDTSKLSIILTSATMGKRMKSRGPKALFDLGHQTLISRQLDVLWGVFPNSDIIVVIGFEAYKIRNHLRDQYPVRFVFNPLWETTNVMFSVSLGMHTSITNNLLIIHGDLLFNEEAIGGITSNGSRLLIDTTASLKDEEVGLVYNKQENIVTNLSYGLPIKWGQMAYLEGRELTLLEKIAHKHHISQMWFLYEGINKIIESNGQFSIHKPNGLHLIDIDTIRDLTRAKSEL